MHCRLWASPSCFLLVTFLLRLSHRHLALAALLPTPRSSSTEEPSSSTAYSVAWSGPAPGDRFGSGDTIVGEWQVAPQNQKIVSPSFRLCVGGEDGCGATIWPEVVEESEGSYHVSLTTPNVTTESGYYLQMKDDFGHIFSSPIFNIASTPQKKNKPAAHPPDVAQPRPDQAPMSSSPSSSSTGTGTTKSNPAAAPAAPAAPADPNGILSPPPSAVASLIPNSASTSSSGSSGGPQVAAAAHNAPPAAAIAVPLSLTGAIILLAGGLALHHRRQLAAEKERASSWSASASSSWPWPWNKYERRSLHAPGLGLAALDHDSEGRSNRDVEKALFFAHGGGGGGGGGALFRGASSYFYAPSSSSYRDACSAPEPRQRTREPGLFTREFTRPRTRPRTHPRTRTRAHPHPSPSPSPSPSSSPPSYRGIWDRRYTLRRSTRSSSSSSNGDGGGGGGGGGSLWRSLSFAAAARHKKVTLQGAAPPSVLNSPAMTVVTSVTSEVLPSYLPSPQFDGSPLIGLTDGQPRGGGEHRDSVNGVGDFGFENVPLSPSLPPPLHTRGEATTDPDDDSRMKELRSVYEAVARALGSTHGV